MRDVSSVPPQAWQEPQKENRNSSVADRPVRHSDGQHMLTISIVKHGESEAFSAFCGCGWVDFSCEQIDGGKLQQLEPYPGDCPSRGLSVLRSRIGDDCRNIRQKAPNF
jgi:hypothetical protein